MKWGTNFTIRASRACR